LNINGKMPNGNGGNGNENSKLSRRSRKRIKNRKKRKNFSQEEARIQNKERRKENKKAKRKYLWEYKAKHGCVRCGEKHPICLGFHHKDKSKKESDVSSLIDRGWKRLKDEIAKCDVMCDNCHKKLHYNEDHSSTSSQNSQNS